MIGNHHNMRMVIVVVHNNRSYRKVYNNNSSDLEEAVARKRIVNHLKRQRNNIRKSCEKGLVNNLDFLELKKLNLLWYE